MIDRMLSTLDPRWLRAMAWTWEALAVAFVATACLWASISEWLHAGVSLATGTGCAYVAMRYRDRHAEATR